MASSISICCFFTRTANSHSSTTFSQRPSSSISQFHSIIRSQTSYSLFLRQNKKISSRYSTRRGCYGVPVIRASRIIETEKVPSDVRKRTMDAIDACGERVTIGDVVSKAGINLNGAQKALQALAADTHGFLELISARDMANRTFIGQDRFVYTTGRDFIEQDYKA